MYLRGLKIIKNNACNRKNKAYYRVAMKAILIKLDKKMFERLAALARQERRKPGPMAALIVERYFNGKA
jgi:hypothetical protein